MWSASTDFLFFWISLPSLVSIAKGMVMPSTSQCNQFSRFSSHLFVDSSMRSMHACVCRTHLFLLFFGACISFCMYLSFTCVCFPLEIQKMMKRADG